MEKHTFYFLSKILQKHLKFLCLSPKPTITDLPNEIIVEIFSYLHNIKDIKSVMLSSKILRTSFLTSTKLMKKVKVSLRNVRPRKYEDQGIHYRNITFDEVMDYLISYGRHISVLNLEDVCFYDNESFLDVLKLVPNIEKLMMIDLKIIEYNGDDYFHDLNKIMYEGDVNFEINHKNLKEKKKSMPKVCPYKKTWYYLNRDPSKIDQASNRAILNFSKLKSIEIKRHVRAPYLVIRKVLKDAKNCSKLTMNFTDNQFDSVAATDILCMEFLKELTVKWEEYDNNKKNINHFMFSSNIGYAFKMKLEKLVIRDTIPWNDYFYAFLKSQSKTIKELKLENNANKSDLMMDMRYTMLFFTAFNNLEKLSIRYPLTFSNRDLNNIGNLRIESVKTLEATIHDANTFTVFLKMFPNIEIYNTKAEIPRNDPRTIDLFFRSFAKLNKVLQVKEEDEESMSGTCWIINRVSNVSEWCRFAYSSKLRVHIYTNRVSVEYLDE